MEVFTKNRSLSRQQHLLCASLRPFRLCVKLSALVFLLTACTTSEEPEEKAPESPGRPQIVGRVASIPPGNSFLLIQSYGDWKVAEGTILTTRGADERAANLLVTGEKLGQFAAADIQAGEVEIGDTVLLLPARVIPPASPPVAEEKQDVDEEESP